MTTLESYNNFTIVSKNIFNTIQEADLLSLNALHAPCLVTTITIIRIRRRSTTNTARGFLNCKIHICIIEVQASVCQEKTREREFYSIEHVSTRIIYPHAS